MFRLRMRGGLSMYFPMLVEMSTALRSFVLGRDLIYLNGPMLLSSCQIVSSFVHLF